LKHADNFLLRNLSTGAMGIVPEGSGRDFWKHPVRTGAFQFVSQQIDQDVVIERNPLSWSTVPKLSRVRFAVVPDAITESLELEKDRAMWPSIPCRLIPCQCLPRGLICALKKPAEPKFNLLLSISATRCSQMCVCARLLPIRSTAI
jgi:peptide/nickel transport system substrate-binding protein